MTKLALLGRAEHLETIDRAVDEVRRGRVVVLSLVGPAGSGRTVLLDEVETRSNEAGLETRRATLYPAGATTPGELTESLGVSLESPLTEPTVLLVSNAQFADGTSLATLQGVIAGATGGVMVAAAHEEISGYHQLSYEQLVDTAQRLGSFLELTLDPLTREDVTPVTATDELARILIDRSGGSAQDLMDLIDQWTATGTLAWDGDKLMATGPPPEPVDVWSRVAALDRPARKLVEAASLAAEPVALPLAAALLEMSSDDVLELGETLAGEGLLRESVEGFLPMNATAAQRVADRMGDVRRARAFGELADATSRLGLEARQPAVVGAYYLEAARWEDALRLLAEAGLAAADRGALGEALPMVQGALRAAEASGSDDAQLEGRLRLARAQCYQAAVWLDVALEDADRAAQLLTGERKVDALGYAATVALDLQKAQEAERYASAGLHEALAIDEPAKHGSLLTLHARIINRLGFGVEADAEYDKGREFVRRHGTSMQLHWAHVNGAWISFDRGQVSQAEVQFAEVTSEAERLGGVPWRVDRQAQWSRALFEKGLVTEALSARRDAIEGADASGLPLTHIPHMSLAEGAVLMGRYEEALGAADDMLAMVMQKRLGWQNAAHYLRAKALSGLGRHDEAAEEIARALEVTPAGVDGWRWGLKIRVLQMTVDAARSEPWPADDALTLTDELLNNKWYLTAAELLIARARYEKDPVSAEEAAALATQLGVPMVAAEAVRVGDLWDKPAGSAVITAIKRMAEHVPEEWREEWSALPSVAPALAAPNVTDEAYEAAIAELEGELQESLAAAGFGSVDTLLSPAQRRAGGLRRRRRRRPVWQLVAAGLGGAGVLAVGGFLAVTLFAPEPPATTIAAPTTTAPTTTTTTTTMPSDNNLGLPDKTDRVAAQWSFRAETGAEDIAALPGVSQRPLLPSADGYYWKFQAADRIRSSPAVFGETVVVGSDDGNLYGVVVTSGPPDLWRVSTGQPISGAPMIAEVAAPGSGPESVDTQMRVFFGSQDGRFRSREVFAQIATPAVFPLAEEPPLASITAEPLIMDGRVFFGTQDGEVWALDASTLSVPQWESPFDVGSAVTVALVGLDEFLFVGTEAGQVWKINAESGVGEVCYEGGGLPISSALVIADGVVYIPVRDALTIDARRADSCRTAPSITLTSPVESSPAIDRNILYTGNGRYLEAWDLDNLAQPIWRYPGADTLGGLPGVVRWPVVVQGGIYFTSDDGWLHAVDNDGKKIWEYEIGASSVTSPAPGTAVVFVADVGGTLHAIGCADPPECVAGDS